MLLLAQERPWFESPGVDAGFTGVWRDRDGRVITWLAPRTMTFHDGLNHHVISGLYQVPDGRVRGLWFSSERLVQPSRSIRQGELERQFGDWTSLNRDNWLRVIYPDSVEESFPYPYTPAPQSSRINQAYIRFGRPDTQGTITNLFLDFFDSRGTLSQSRQYFYLGPVAQIAVKGTFSGDQVDAVLEFAPARSRLPAFRGSLTVAQRSYVIEGLFVGARGTYRALDPTTGNVILRGYLEWSPSPAYARNLTKDQPFTTDRIVARFVAPGFPSGKSATLTLK